MATGAVADIHPFAAYCGAPPEPANLLGRWNLDPWLLASLLVGGAAYTLAMSTAAGRSRGEHRWRHVCFYAGWGVGALALTSPLCALSVSLFSARVGQHMVLETIAAPLIAFGLPWDKSDRPLGALTATGAFAAILWFWHAPGPYAATFKSAGVYWTMHITAFGAALWFWRAILQAARERTAIFLAAMLGASLQMGFLGALLTFATRPLFVVHALTTTPWGLTPLQDQQLGGALMWVPAAAIFLAGVVAGVAIAMGAAEDRARAVSAARV